MSTYRVINLAGGTIYRGDSLRAAARESVGPWGSGYVEDCNGARPVIEDEDGQPLIGEYGQTMDDLRATVAS